MGHNIRDSVLSEGLSLDLAELEAGFLTFDADWLETSLDIVEDAEVLVGLGDLNDVLETEWELGVSSDLAINLDQTFSLSADFDRFLAGESVFKSVLEKDGQWDALTELVGSSRWAVGVHTSQFVQAPGGWCEHSLQMLFGSSCLYKSSASELRGLPTSSKINSRRSGKQKLAWSDLLERNFSTYHFTKGS